MKTLFTLPWSDASLVRSAIADRPEAFEELVARYLKKAHAIARSLGVHPGSTEDVVQESFLRAFRELASLRSPDAFGPWFLQIVRNSAREHLKKAERSQGCPFLESDLRDPGPRPCEATEEKDFDEYLWRKVSELPQGIRDAVFLYYHDGESTRSVAKALGISRSNVKYRLQEGRNILRARLWREMERGFREILGTERDWKRKARRLALVAMLCVPPSSALRAGEAATASVGAGFPVWMSVMISKRAISLAVLLILLALSAVTVTTDPFGWRRRDREAAPVPIAGSGAGTVASPPAEAGKAGIADGAPAIGKVTMTSISGTIFLDDGQTPAPVASVAARTDSGAPRSEAIVAAGEDGRYEIRGLPPGEYDLEAWKETWTTEYYAIRTVEIEEGESSAGNDIVMTPGVIVTGRAVEEGTGKPIPGAEIEWGSRRTAVSDRDGRFRLEGVPAGTLVLTAIAEGYAGRRLSTDVAVGENPSITIEMGPGGVIGGLVLTPEGEPAPGAQVIATLGARWSRLQIRRKADGEGRFRLSGIPIAATDIEIMAVLNSYFFKGSAVLHAFPPGETRAEVDVHLGPGLDVAGRVVDVEGAPIAGVRIDTCYGGRIPPTDAEGRFRIEGAEESMRLSFRKKGLAPAWYDLTGRSPSDREDIEIVLEPGHRLSGIVEDLEGNPIAGAVVCADTPTNFMPPIRETHTDREGRFRFDDLLPGISLFARKAGYRGNRVEPVELERDDVRVVLELAGQIQGTVLEKGSRTPIHPFAVKFRVGANPAVDRPHWDFMSGTEWSQENSYDAEEGRFAIRDLIVGMRYTLTVVADGFREAVVEDVPARDPSQEMDPLLVELEPGDAVAGIVVAKATGKPIEGVRVAFLSGGSANIVEEWCRDRDQRIVTRTALSDARGSFTIAGLSSGPGALVLEKAGFGRVAFTGLSPGGRVQAFALEAEATIEGTAWTAAGEPVPEAGVEVSLGGQGQRRATTDGQGRYRVEGLPAGEAEVVLVPSKGMRQRQRAMLTAGKVEVVDFIQALGGISGRVTRRGEPALEAQVLVRHAIDPAIRETTTATDDGRFRIVGLPEGTYLVGAKSFDRSGEIEARRIVEVGETEAKVDIEISGAGICGEVVDRRTGQPLPGATVLLFSRSTGYVPADRLRFPFDWKLRDARRLPPAEAGFAFAEIEEGIYYLVAALPDGNEAIGWLGPFELPKGGVVEGLALPAGGAESLEVEAVDARTRSPVERFHVALRLESGIALLEQDGAGKVAFRSIPTGSYLLEVSSSEYLSASEGLQLDGQSVARVVQLEPAAWIVVELDGRTGTAGAAFEAVAMSGGDPGWRARTAEGNHPVLVDAHGPGDVQPFRLKIRPGRYTMRFEVATRSADLGIRPLVMREIEVSVPPAGESVVKLQIQPMK